MDPISSLGNSSATAPRPGAAVDRYSDLTTQDFVKIMFTELGNQDPTQPSDSKALLDQLSSLRNIQSSMALSTRLDDLVSQGQLNSAAGLIGKYVRGLSENNETVTGQVYSVSRTEDGAVLNLYTGQRVPMKNLSDLVDLPADGGQS
jgi:flagellar basal-body rod modification protein FlgD